jgi:hypothetical protein
MSEIEEKHAKSSMSDLVRGEQGISIANHVLDQSWSAINNCKKQLARP